MQANDGSMVASVLVPGTQVLIYGGGGFGEWLGSAVGGQGLEVVAVVDESPGQCSWASSLSLEEASARFAGLPVLIGVFSPQPDVVAIVANLRSAGFPRLVTPPQAFAWLGAAGQAADRYWLTTDIGLYGTSSAGIQAARALLGDDESREVFDGTLAYRLGSGAESYPRPRPLSEQHTGIDFGFLPHRAGTVVDCGAFVGDTFPNWQDAGLSHAQVLALEPDPTSFPAMIRAASGSPLRIVPLPIGVAERTGTYSVEGQGASARLVPDPMGQIVAMSLDDLLVRTEASFIKMDIEGGEAAALRGAAAVIQRDRPHLAISAYHKPWHLWSLANWLDGLVEGYEYRLRAYGHQGYDTVLYARPI